MFHSSFVSFYTIILLSCATKKIQIWPAGDERLIFYFEPSRSISGHGSWFFALPYLTESALKYSNNMTFWKLQPRFSSHWRDFVFGLFCIWIILDKIIKISKTVSTIGISVKFRSYMSKLIGNNWKYTVFRA